MIKIVNLNRNVFKELRKDGLQGASVIDRYKGILTHDEEVVTVTLPEGCRLEYRNFFYEDVLIKQGSNKFFMNNHEFERIEIS